MDFTRIAYGSWDGRNRSTQLKEASRILFDVIVIGGGITGAGIALDAASRGLKVLLLEKSDFASGTSGKSTKLIHGGLRYLKQLDFALVREVGRERSILKRNAPHLVYPEDMLLPVYAHGSLGKWSLRAALSLYEALAGVEKGERFRMLSAAEVAAHEPLIHTDGLLGGALYKEYRSDDARLCISVLKTAVHYGAVALNYVKVQDFITESGSISGLTATDETTGNSYQFKSRVVVNAAGPWVDDLREKAGAQSNKHLMLTRGIHLVVDGGRFPLHSSVYFDVGDGRMIFAIPREGKVYIGTTDEVHRGSTDEPGYTLNERNYLLAAVNRCFPEIKLSAADIESAWSGLRPLIAERNKKPSEVSRKDEIFEHPNGLLSIAGGKLTGYRRMAEKIMKRVVAKLKAKGLSNVPECKTASIGLSGGEFSHSAEVEEYAGIQFGEAKQIGADVKTIHRWVLRYGRNTEKIVELAYNLWPSVEDKSLVTQMAEMAYCISEESVVFAGDFWVRRSGAIYFGWPSFLENVSRFEGLFAQAGCAPDEVRKEQGYALYREIDQIVALRKLEE